MTMAEPDDVAARDEIYCLKILVDATQKDSPIDIVAIHGIGADPDDTWIHKESRTNWLKDPEMLPHAIPSARIMRFGYESKWFGDENDNAREVHVHNIAQMLLTQLQRSREEQPARPLLFIAHSFGGHVLMQALRRSYDYPSRWSHPFGSTAGLVFLGTPFRGREGVSLEEWVDRLVEKNKDRPSFQTWPATMRHSIPENPYLDTIRERFLETRCGDHPVPVCCFYETFPSPVGLLIDGSFQKEYLVKEHSACLDLSKSISKHPLDRHHFNLQKFESDNDEGYKTLRDECVKLANDARKFLDDRSLRAGPTEKEFQGRFLQSLHFPEINRRQEEIKEAYKNTFQWIFDQTGKAVKPWSNFTEWLENGSGTYWINGKPGSGKSTLMNYICEDERTQDALTVWADNRKLLIPTFFFWAAGTNLQQTVVGLLRSLIYQILRGDPSLLNLTSSEKILQQLRLPYPGNSEPFPTWTEKRLRKCFSALMTSITTSYCVCIFIDGLDELHGDRDELIDIISGISQHPGVKFCLSSRPDKPFREAFGQSSMLELQDLTSQDINEYIKAKLQNMPQLKTLSVENQIGTQWLFDELTVKAQGVFLWVELAVKSLINGIKYDDGFDILVQRLFALPIEIEGLYVDMLKRIDPFHHHEVAKHIRCTKDSHQYYQDVGRFIRGDEGGDVTEEVNKRRFPLSVFDHTLAIHCLNDDLRVKEKRSKTSDIDSKCAITNGRINSICAGFLEVSDSLEHDPGEFEAGEPKFDDTWTSWEQEFAVREQFNYDWRSRKVNFCHRTALDFFTRENGEGASFLDSHSPKISNPRFLMAALELAKLKLCNLVEPFEYLCFYVSHIMSIFCLNYQDCDEINDIQWTSFLDYLDGVIASLDQQFNDTVNGSHWCTRLKLQNLHTGSYSLEPFQSRASIAVLNKKLPNDFLGLTARFKIIPYVRHALTRPNIVNNSERAIHLAFNLVAYTDSPSSLWGSGFTWGIESYGTLEVVSELVYRGANPNAGLRTSIWEEALNFVIQQCIRRDRDICMPEHFSLSQCLTNFLDAGVDPFPTLLLSPPSGRTEINPWFQCDPSRLPTFQKLLPGHEDPSSMQTLQNLRQSGSKAKIVRIWFLLRGDFWPPSGHPLDQEQTESLHTAVERLISCPDGMVNESKRKLAKVFEEIWYSIAPPNSYSHSPRYPYNSDEASNPETDSVAEEGSDEEISESSDIDDQSESAPSPLTT